MAKLLLQPSVCASSQLALLQAAQGAACARASDQTLKWAEQHVAGQVAELCSESATAITVSVRGTLCCWPSQVAVAFAVKHTSFICVLTKREQFWVERHPVFLRVRMRTCETCDLFPTGI